MGKAYSRSRRSSPNLLGAHGLAVGAEGLHLIGSPGSGRTAPGRHFPGLPAVDHHHKGLAGGLHIPNGPVLGGQGSPPGNVRDGAVGGHHQANGAVILHHLFGAQLRCLGHGDLMVVPGGWSPSRAPRPPWRPRPRPPYSPLSQSSAPELRRPVGGDLPPPPPARTWAPTS